MSCVDVQSISAWIQSRGTLFYKIPLYGPNYFSIKDSHAYLDTKELKL